MEKIDLAGRCLATPVLFFALADGHHPQSECVIAKLRVTLEEKCPNGIPLPECKLFACIEDAQSYLWEKQIDVNCTVMLFDVPYSGGNRFLALQRGTKRKGVSMPLWSPVRWAVAINAKINKSSVRSAAYQITADFLTHFPSRLTGEMRPWGVLPVTHRSGNERRRKRNNRRRDGLFSFFAIA